MFSRKTKMTATTIPSHALDCACDICEDLPVHTVKRFSYQAEESACLAARVSPLARAALDNGVSFADVEAYCNGCKGEQLASIIYELLLAYDDAPSSTSPVRASAALDGALTRSFLAQRDGSIAGARVWWLGVLS